jgi:hypothetical protein
MSSLSAREGARELAETQSVASPPRGSHGAHRSRSGPGERSRRSTACRLTSRTAPAPQSRSPAYAGIVAGGLLAVLHSRSERGADGSLTQEPESCVPVVSRLAAWVPRAVTRWGRGRTSTAVAMRAARARLYQPGLRFGIVGLHPRSNVPALTRYDALGRRGRPVCVTLSLTSLLTSLASGDYPRSHSSSRTGT